MKVTIYQTYTKNKFPFNLFAVLIKLFQRTNYSHYAMSYMDEAGDTKYCDSTTMGVRELPESKFIKGNEIKKAFVLDVKGIERVDFLRWFNKHQGKSYGFLQIIGLLLKIFNIVRHNPLGKGAKRIICNELVILFLNRFYGAGVKDTDSLDLVETEQLISELIYEK